MLFKVAILQKRATNAQIDKNIETIIETMKEAAKNNADILLLPECFITGYDLPMTYEKSISDDSSGFHRAAGTKDGTVPIESGIFG